LIIEQSYDLYIIAIFIIHIPVIVIDFFLHSFSQTGIFDWLIGRQEEPWNYTRRFIRDFSGMSLRGLVWTLPQGYVLEQLDFGWQYSLSGSLMGVVYYIGSLVSVRLFSFFNSTIAYSEFIWGTWIWFVLVVCNATQLIHYARQWIHSRRVSNLVNPHAKYHQFLYKSLNHEAIAVLYQLLVMMLWAIFAASVVFYSLVIQPDIRNKGQTEFGLFISTICLTFFIGWKWSSVYTRWQLQKSQIPVRLIQRSNRTHSQINTIGNLQRVNQQLSSRETDPLLPWPYSHPDKARYSPVGLSNDVSRSSVSNYTHYKANDRLRGDYLSPLASCAVSCWGALEKWVWLDLFAWIRHMIGILSLIATLLTVAMALIAFALDLYSPRFDSKYVVCNATTI
jgi:hypothetical protein